MRNAFLKNNSRKTLFKYNPRFLEGENNSLSEINFLGKRFANGYLKKKNSLRANSQDKINLSEFRNHKKSTWLKSSKNVKYLLLYLAIILAFVYSMLQFIANFS